MTRIAAIDVGTNTVRLIHAEVGEDGLHGDVRRQQITRLGEGVDDRRVLSVPAIDRTVEAIVGFEREAREAGAERVRIVGTSAVRDAQNARAFIEAVDDRTGLEVEVLEGEDEGRLSFLGATRGVEGGPFLVCDIGGGSTEFVRGHRWMESVWSADVGSVRIRERYFSSDPPTRGELAGAVTLISSELLQVERDVGLVGDETLVGVAGTVTTLATVMLGLGAYDPAKVHGARFSRSQVAARTAELLATPIAGVRALPGVQEGRADVLASGALILREVMERWSLAELVVSEHDILDGLLLDIVLGPEAGLPPMVDPTA